MSYKQQIEELTKNPGKIEGDWKMGVGLFKVIGNCSSLKNGNPTFSGCLTQIRQSPDYYGAFIDDKFEEQLTKEIAADERIPTSPNKITVADLEVFEEWQTRIDELQKQAYAEVQGPLAEA